MSPRPPTHLRIGSMTTILTLLVAGSAATLASLASVGFFHRSAYRADDQPPTTTELAASLARVGITAESLAAAGCSTTDATTLVTYARSELDAATWASLQAADGSVKSAQADVDRLGRLIRAGQASQQDLTDADTAASTLASATAARDAILDGLLDAAVAGLDQAEAATLGTMHGNEARPVPLSYRVAARTDAEWTSLRDALANIKTSARCGEEADSACTALVTQCDAENNVAAARSNLDSNLAQVAAAFEDALGLNG